MLLIFFTKLTTLGGVVYFNQRLDAEHPKRWSKYVLVGVSVIPMPWLV